MGGRSGWWTRDTSEAPNGAVESCWSAILEETPDPQGRFWVSADQAQRLLRRVETGDLTPDPVLLQLLSEATSSESGESRPTPK